jgi:hypothetical protein
MWSAVQARLYSDALQELRREQKRKVEEEKVRPDCVVCCASATSLMRCRHSASSRNGRRTKYFLRSTVKRRRSARTRFRQPLTANGRMRPWAVDESVDGPLAEPSARMRRCVQTSRSAVQA